jgi:hypothetical protein
LLCGSYLSAARDTRADAGDAALHADSYADSYADSAADAGPVDSPGRQQRSLARKSAEHTCRVTAGELYISLSVLGQGEILIESPLAAARLIALDRPIARCPPP